MENKVIKGISLHRYKTTAEWENDTLIISQGEFIVYSDAFETTNDQQEKITIAGIKIGDGAHQAKDLEFIGGISNNNDLTIVSVVQDAQGNYIITLSNNETITLYQGSSITIDNISQSTIPGGKSVVTFSDGSVLEVYNGLNGSGEGGIDVPIYKGTTNNSLIFFDGEATAEYAIAAGTNQKDAIIPIVGNTLADAITVNKPKASGVGALAAGGGAEATSAGAVAIGSLNRVGVTGFYWSDIVWNTDGSATITLSTKQGTADWTGNPTIDWEAKKAGVFILGEVVGDYVGDRISIVNDAKYPACATIINVDKTNHKITVDSLPFTEKKTPSNILPDDYTIFACGRIDVTTGKTEIDSTSNLIHSRWYPRSGSVTIGWAGAAFGIENLISGSAALSAGWNNWAAGDFGAVFGRDNIAGYATLVSGTGNIVSATNALVGGSSNKVTSQGALVGGSSNTVASGNALVGGANHSLTNGASCTIVGGDGNILDSAWCSAVFGNLNNVKGQLNIIGGQYVKNTGYKNLILGDRIADAVAKGAEQTYTITEVTGSNNVVGGHGNFVSSSHSAAFGTRHKLTGNKGQIAAGSNNALTNWNNAAFGRHLNVDTSAMVAVGQFNKKTSYLDENKNTINREMFVVGNGNASSSGAGNKDGAALEKVDNGSEMSIVRDNAFVVYYNGSYVGGYGHTLSDGKCNAISGRGHIVPSSQCIVAGQSNKVQSGNSGAMGYLNTINTSCSGAFATGTGNIIAKGNQLTCGMCNVSSTSAFFVVGNGSYVTASKYKELSDTEKAKYTTETAPDGNTIYTIRKNAFVVHSDGRATVGANPKNDMDVVTKSYLENMTFPTWTPNEGGY